jgi:hypothetical protein
VPLDDQPEGRLISLLAAADEFGFGRVFESHFGSDRWSPAVKGYRDRNRVRHVLFDACFRDRVS